MVSYGKSIGRPIRCLWVENDPNSLERKRSFPCVFGVFECVLNRVMFVVWCPLGSPRASHWGLWVENDPNSLERKRSFPYVFGVFECVLNRVMFVIWCPM
jgi:hypothetical protein